MEKGTRVNSVKSNSHTDCSIGAVSIICGLKVSAILGEPSILCLETVLSLDHRFLLDFSNVHKLLRQSSTRYPPKYRK